MQGIEVLRRWLRHVAAPARPQLIDDAALDRLAALVTQLESTHSGEICLCVEARLPFSYLRRPHAMARIVRQRAVAQFGKLRVWDTEYNNGVLIYLQLCERAIEIVADRGIARRVAQAEWDALVQTLSSALRQGKYEQGLAEAARAVSALLQQHFPLAPGETNPNEIPDAPRTGE